MGKHALKPGSFTITPVIFEWTDGKMVPLSRFRNVCVRQFEESKQYSLGEIEERSFKSHGHYFAAVGEAWKNLPEIYAQEFVTAEHLRKYALIKTRWFNLESMVLGRKADALKVVAFARKHDEFAIVTIEKNTVRVYTAMSQSIPAMGRADFQESKSNVLDFLDDLLQVERGSLSANAGMSA